MAWKKEHSLLPKRHKNVDSCSFASLAALQLAVLSLPTTTALSNMVILLLHITALRMPGRPQVPWRKGKEKGVAYNLYNAQPDKKTIGLITFCKHNTYKCFVYSYILANRFFYVWLGFSASPSYPCTYARKRTTVQQQTRCIILELRHTQDEKREREDSSNRRIAVLSVGPFLTGCLIYALNEMKYYINLRLKNEKKDYQSILNVLSFANATMAGGFVINMMSRKMPFSCIFRCWLQSYYVQYIATS